MRLFSKLLSPIVLSLFMTEATSSGLDVVYQVVLHAAPNPQYLRLNTPLHWVRLVAQKL